MRHPSFGNTRKVIMKWLLAVFVMSFLAVFLSMIFPSVTLGDNALEFLKTMLAPVSLMFVGFFSAETYNEHSARKNGEKKDDS